MAYFLMFLSVSMSLCPYLLAQGSTYNIQLKAKEPVGDFSKNSTCIQVFYDFIIFVEYLEGGHILKNTSGHLFGSSFPKPPYLE